MFILDKQQQLVPAGVTGELYIGGAGVARGYLQRPEQTAEMFIPHPFSSEPGRRLYKSGDLARYNSEGQIVYLGRGDHQVKLRGHRIELGEVETVLSEHEAVSECFVAVREFKSGEKRLVGYVVGVAGHEVSPRELRTFMKKRLPEYMAPGDYVVLDEMPLTPGGKIDRRALIGTQKSFETERQFVAPRTPTEEALAEIWSELLDIERPSIHDNFFDLGGHSLLLTMLASRIRTTMDVDLPLRVLFEQPTIDAISVAILDYQVQHADSSEIAQMLEEVKQLSPEDVSFHLAAISNEVRLSQ